MSEDPEVVRGSRPAGATEPEGTLNAFLRQFTADVVGHGAPKPLPDYQALWPAAAGAIAAHYPRLVEDLRGGAAAAESAPAGIERIGPYRLLRRLGRGGQASVHLAEDLRLKRQVALKVLTGLSRISPGALARFRREAELASRLQHPNICPIHDAGEFESVPYIVMQHIPGETLAERIAAARSVSTDPESPSLVVVDAEAPPPETSCEVSLAAAKGPPAAEEVRALVDVFVRIARAVHFAHEHGVIHRDLKPGNVMLTPAGEPVILDFGLAGTDDGEGATLTRSGEIFGTPAYMSPEQIAAGRSGLDHRTDIWSLGVTLYEAITLERPFAAPTREALYRRILNADPAPARRLNPAVGEDLAVVVATAMEKDADRRYQSALVLAEELERVRDGRPIQARPAGPATRLWLWARRNPGLAASLFGLAATLAAGLTVSILLLLGSRAESRAKGEALREAGIERAAKEKAITRLGALALGGASRAVTGRDPMLRLLLAREAASVSPAAGFAPLREALHESLARTLLPRHYGSVRRAIFDASGERILTASADGTVHVVSGDGRVLADLRGHEGGITDAVLLPPGDRVATASDDGTARVWSLSGNVLRIFAGHEDAVRCLAVASDGSMLATGSSDGTVRFWTLDGQSRATVPGHAGGVRSVSWTPSGEHLVALAGNGAAFVWNRDGAKRAVLAPEDHKIVSAWAVPSASGGEVITAGDDGSLRVFDLDGRPVRVLQPSDGKSLRADVAGETVLSWTRDGVIRLRDREGRLRSEFRAAESPLTRCVLAPAGDAVAVGSEDGSLRIFECGTGRETPVRTRLWNTTAVTALAWSPDGERLAAGFGVGESVVYARRADLPWVLPWAGAKSASVAPDRRRFAVHDAGVLRVFDYGSGTIVPVEKYVAGAGESFVTGTVDPPWDRVLVRREGGFSVCDHSGHEVAAVRTEAGLKTAVWSPAGQALVLKLDGEAEARLFKWDGGVRESRFAWPAGGVRFSGNGAKLWSIAPDRVLVLTLESGEWAASEPLELAPIGRFAVSPAGDRCIVVPFDGVAREFDDRARLVRVSKDANYTGWGGQGYSPSGEHLAIGVYPTSVLVLGPDRSVACRVERDTPGTVLDFAGEDRVYLQAAVGETTLFTVGGELLDQIIVPGFQLAGTAVSAASGLAVSFDAERVLVTSLSEAHLRELAAQRIHRDFAANERREFAEVLGGRQAEVLEAQSWILRQHDPAPIPDSMMRERVRSIPGSAAMLRRDVEELLRQAVPDTWRLNFLSWRAAIDPKASRDACETGLAAAEELLRLSPGSGAWLNTLGLLQYRLGRHAEALATLERSDLLNRRQINPEGVGEDSIAIALVLWKLGRPDDARRAAGKVRALFRSRTPSEDEQKLLDELSTLVPAAKGP